MATRTWVQGQGQGLALLGTGLRERRLWKSSDRHKRRIKIKPARREAACTFLVANRQTFKAKNKVKDLKLSLMAP